MTPRAVLWDLDGTLADSRDFHWESWRDAMGAAGAAVTEAQFLASFGQRNDTIIPRWIPGATPDVVRRIADDKEQRYRDFVRDRGLDPLPGAADWVRRLARDGWRQAIASSAPRQNVELMAEVLGLAPFMMICVGAEDVRHGKPDPDVFLAAAAGLDVPPARCLVVEDAVAGVEAAHRAGMRCIGVGQGPLDAADLRAASLDQLPTDAFDRLLA